MGSFGFQPKLFKYAGKGGPLGELVQWTDTLCGLYILGYDVNVYLNITEMGYVFLVHLFVGFSQPISLEHCIRFKSILQL